MKNGWTEALAEKDKEIEKHAEMLQQRGEIIVRLDKQIAALKKWVNDLQSGMYINCVYCGHRYGPNVSTPVAMADVLKEHIEKCPKHPLSEARREIAALKAERNGYLNGQQQMQDTCSRLQDSIVKYDEERKALKAEVTRLREALGKIARGSDDVDSSDNKSPPFDGDFAQTIAQDALVGKDGRDEREG